MTSSHQSSGQAEASVDCGPAGPDTGVAGPGENPSAGVGGKPGGPGTVATAPGQSCSSPVDCMLGTESPEVREDIHSAGQMAEDHNRWGHGVLAAAAAFGIGAAPRATT